MENSVTEYWQDVPGFGGHYQASTLGRIRSKARIVRKRHKGGRVCEQYYGERILTNKPDASGYIRVHISVDGRKMAIATHRLVAMAFHGLPKEGQECCHNNGNPSDNRPGNLRWDSHLENNRDRLRHGTYLCGTAHHQSKFSPELLNDIRRGLLTRPAAMARGVSHTHYYRVRAEAERLANG